MIAGIALALAYVAFRGCAAEHSTAVEQPLTQPSPRAGVPLRPAGDGPHREAVAPARTIVGGSKKVDLPCCGVFEMANGKIKVWRDYFDMATYTKPLQG